MLYTHVIKGVVQYSDMLPNLLVGFLLKSARSKLCTSGLKNCGMPSFALKIDENINHTSSQMIQKKKKKNYISNNLDKTKLKQHRYTHTRRLVRYKDLFVFMLVFLCNNMRDGPIDI